MLLTSTIRAAGLDVALRTALAPWRASLARHDPAKVLLDLALTLALGGEACSDVAVVRAEPAEHLRQRWSPRQIACEARVRFPDDSTMWLCPESIYQAIYAPGSSLTRGAVRPPARSPATHRTRSPQGAPLARAAPAPLHRARAEHPRAALPARGPLLCRRLGRHLIVGPGHRSAIGTLLERHTRFVKLIHLPAQDSRALRDAIIKDFAGLPARLRTSITWDQGTEMSRQLDITAALGTKVYFADAHSPWQRGSNEDTNGLLRQYFPKGTDLSRHTQADLKFVANELNARPRATTGRPFGHPASVGEPPLLR